MQQQYYADMQVNDNSVAYGFAGQNHHHHQHQQMQNPYYDQTDSFRPMAAEPVDDIGQHFHQTTTQRVAAAMYPDAIDTGTEIPSTQYSGHQTAVQRLAEPSQMLRHAVVNLINYQDDADLASQALPELIRLLNDEDQYVVGQAALIVNQLSRKEASRLALSGSIPLVTALLQTLEHSNDLETTKFASETLSSISQNHQGLLAIFKTGGIRALIHALGSPIDAVMFNALKTIHNLLLHQEGAKMTVRLNGGLQKMVSLLQRDNVKFLALVTDCLHILAYGNQESKLIILASGGPSELVRLMHSHNYEKLLFTTARVLKVLSVCPNNKPAIIQTGGMQALALCLDHQSRRLVQECLWALRNLSDGAAKELNLEPLLQRLVQLLAGTDINIVTCAVGTLSNLTCNNQMNKSFVYKANGVQALLQTLRNAIDHDEIAEPTVCALRHLTNRHPEAGLILEAMRVHGGLPDVAKLLDYPSKWHITMAAAGLIRNLCLNPQNSSALGDLNVIQKLSFALNSAIQVMQDPTHATAIAGVEMEKVVESLVGALRSLAGDKTPEFTQRLSNEINTLFQNENNDGRWIENSGQDVPAIYDMEGGQTQQHQTHEPWFDTDL